MSDEPDFSLLSAEATEDALRTPPPELAEALTAALENALGDPEVQHAFRELFTPEELEQLHDLDSSALAEALRQELATDPTFREALSEDLLGWVGQVSISLPADEPGLDAYIEHWQLP